jgi:uncharacterized lipoprotein YajG
MPKYRSALETPLLFLLFAVILLAGCAGTTIVSRNGPSAAAHKLASAKVTWVANPSLPFHIHKSARGYQPVIDESDQLYARHVVGRLLNLFQQSAPQILTEKLAQRGVTSDDAILIKVSPTTANVNIGLGRGFTSHVSIIEGKSGKELWSITVNAFGSPWDEDKELLTNFVARVITELQIAGWLS